jgi:hypothetical protein
MNFFFFSYVKINKNFFQVIKNHMKIINNKILLKFNITDKIIIKRKKKFIKI